MGLAGLAPWYVGAIVSGALFGYVVRFVFRRLVSPGTTRRYWVGISQDIHGILYGDVDHFWRHYINIIRDTVLYVSRQLFGIALAFAPIVVVFLVVGPSLYATWDRDAPLGVIPADAGVLTRDEGLSEPNASAPTTLTLKNGHVLTIPSKPGSQVVCVRGSVGCLVLLGFGFTAITLDQPSLGKDNLVVIRTMHDDWNPLWPYLSDPEFLFFLSLSVVSAWSLVSKRKAPVQPKAIYSVGFLDFVLAQLATSNMRMMNRLGDWETSINSKRIANIRIEKPIFIVGLARSGTTILLEKIAGIDGVATHKYRDFPFVMTPVFWNWFMSLFGAKQNPIERPHQDDIQITRDSPEAFEEPIWQYYFPYAHDVTKLHTMGADVDAPEFARFYRQHIQKILLIRGGSRYLSKGNYNLPRIEYISQIFPDALFLIPIRHPLSHVASLVHQHHLFSNYAANDPRLPSYLEAVGHYEFGTQRKPVCVTDSGGQQAIAAWDAGNNSTGYAMQWNDVYRLVADLFAKNEELSRRMRIVRFEELCDRPEQEFQRILEFTELDSRASSKNLAHGIKPSSNSNNVSPEETAAIWKVVEDTAGLYGYSLDPEGVLDYSTTGFVKN